MSIIKIKGIVLRQAYSSEADKIITILAKDKGKKTIAAKGARLPKSPFLAGTQPFCYCDFVIYDNKSIANLNQVEVIETFYNIRQDLFKLSYASYFMELAENSIVEEDASNELLELTLKALQILNKTDDNPKLIAKIYELRLIKILGYMPEIYECVNCGHKIENREFFDVQLGGTLCEKCKSSSNRCLELSLGTFSAIEYIMYSDIKRLFSFKVSPLVLEQLSKISTDYIFIHIDHEFKTLKFLNQL